MQGPDENAPTLPGRNPPPTPPANQPYEWVAADDATPMGAPVNAPPATNDGPPPIWTVATPAKPQPGSPNFSNFGMGFAISLLVLAAMVLGIVAVLTVNGRNAAVAQPSTTPPPTVTATANPQVPTATALPPIDMGTATNTVTSYYDFINAHDFQKAYSLQSNDYQSKHTLDQFKQDWQNIDTVLVDPTSLNTTQGQVTNVLVTLTYQTQTHNGPQKTFQASLVVGYDRGLVRILALTKNDVTPAVTPTVVAPTATTQPTQVVPTTTTQPTVTATSTSGTPTPTPHA